MYFYSISSYYTWSNDTHKTSSLQFYINKVFQCDSGYYGIDCSVPSALSPMQEWPVWLRPAKVDLPDKVSINGDLMTIKAVVKKKRPLIYVYDLPPEFNAHLLEVRLWFIVFVWFNDQKCFISSPFSPYRVDISSLSVLTEYIQTRTGHCGQINYMGQRCELTRP